jgi:hypothetical protein
MAIEETKAAVEGYTEGWIAKDLDAARTHLADELDFQGSIDRLTRADDLIAAIRGLIPIIRKVDRLDALYDGDRAFLLYDLVTESPAGTLRCAEHFVVRGGKIVRMRLVFDATELRKMMGR